MKVVCSRNELINGINTVQKAISSKPVMTILEGILIQCTENNLKLTGNDLELAVEYTIDAEVSNMGSIVVNSRMLGEIVKKLPDSKVTIEVNSRSNIIIDCLNTHFELMGIDASTYPALPEVEKENPYTIKQEILKDMIRQTIFSVGVDENRKTLMGSLIECKNNQLFVVAIDGFRVSIRRNIDEIKADDFSVILPGKTLNEIIKILQTDENAITLYSSKSLILFEMENCRIISRLIEGNYLNYENILPIDFETKIVFNTKELLMSIERASLLSFDEKKYPLKFIIHDNKIVLISNSDKGTAKDELEVEIEGQNQEIGFNPKYFIDALKAIDDEELCIYFTSSVGPCTIKPKEGNSYTYMILPVRTHSDDEEYKEE